MVKWLMIKELVTIPFQKYDSTFKEIKWQSKDKQKEYNTVKHTSIYNTFPDKKGILKIEFISLIFSG